VLLATWAGLGSTAALAQAGCRYTRVAGIPLRWTDGRPYIDGRIEDHPLPMLVDTGAADPVMSSAMAESLGLSLRHAQERWVGIDGESQGYYARVRSLAVGPLEFSRLKVRVRDDSSESLMVLGAGFLFQHDLELGQGALNLLQPHGCGDGSLAYWADDVPVVPLERSVDGAAVVIVRLDGQALRALIDSGAQTSVLDLPAARRLGFRPEDGVAIGRLNDSQALGPQAWRAPFRSFAIGPEEISRPHLTVADLSAAARQQASGFGGPAAIGDRIDLLLGADFLQSHRVLFAFSQRRFYFSYLGGDIFMVPAISAAAAPAPSASATPPNAH